MSGDVVERLRASVQQFEDDLCEDLAAAEHTGERVDLWTREIDVPVDDLIEAASLITSQAAEIERLTKERDEALEERLTAELEMAKARRHAQEVQGTADLWSMFTYDGAPGMLPKLWAMVKDWRGKAKAHIARAETAERLLAEARAALEPFARYETADGEGLDDELFRIPDGHALLGNGIGDNWTPVVTVGDFRRARTLTNGGENGR